MIKYLKYALVIFFSIYLGSSVIRGLINNKRIIKSYDHVLAELAYEKQRNKDLKMQLVMTENPEHIELLARRKLGLVKNGEIVYKIVYLN